jgi:hypothetical protein
VEWGTISTSSRMCSCESHDILLHAGVRVRLMVSEFPGRWGRNSYGVTSPPHDSAASTSTSSSAPAQTVKRPAIAAPLSDLILRDLALSATYGVAVDANGDVLQWGSGFSPQGHVERTLTGRDIVKVAATQEGKVFGLSKRGQVYVWAADKASQDVNRERNAIEGFEWPRRNQDGDGAGWMMLLGKGILWGRGGTGGNVETVRLGTDVQLERGEKCVFSSSLTSGPVRTTVLTALVRAQVHVTLGRGFSPPRIDQQRPVVCPPALPRRQRARSTRRPVRDAPRPSSPGQFPDERAVDPPRTGREVERDGVGKSARAAEEIGPAPVAGCDPSDAFATGPAHGPHPPSPHTSSRICRPGHPLAPRPGTPRRTRAVDSFLHDVARDPGPPWCPSGRTRRGQEPQLGEAWRQDAWTCARMGVQQLWATRWVLLFPGAVALPVRVTTKGL